MSSNDDSSSGIALALSLLVIAMGGVRAMDESDLASTDTSDRSGWQYVLFGVGLLIALVGFVVGTLILYYWSTDKIGDWRKERKYRKLEAESRKRANERQRLSAVSRQGSL